MLSAHIYSRTPSRHPLLSPGLSPCTLLPIIRAKNIRNRAKRGKSYILFGALWCFLGVLRDRKGRNLRYILVLGVAGLPLRLSLWGGGGVHWAQVVQCAGASGGLLWCVPSLSSCLLSLCCFCFPAIPAKYALFRILRGF